jgi:hypothetical protein
MARTVCPQDAAQTDVEHVLEAVLENLIFKNEGTIKSQADVERCLSFLAKFRAVKEEVRNMIPTNYDAALRFVDDHYGNPIPEEVVYDMCGSCYGLYRCESKDAVQCPR